MKRTSVGAIVVVSVAATTLLFTLLPAANSQVRANPSYLPIGTSSSGSTSTVWFHEPLSGRTLACQTVNTSAAGLTGIQCVSAKFPSQDSP
jgi:hypothetical protein